MTQTRRSVLKNLAAGALASLSGSQRAGAYLAQTADEIAAKKYFVRVNCAGPAADGFLADQPYQTIGWGYTHGGQYWKCDSVANDFGLPTAIKTARYSCGAPFHYKFDVPNGYYRVKMYFVSPNEFSGPRIFDVVLNNRVVLPRFRAFRLNTGVLKQFDEIPISDGEIDITFRSINDACLISAIEVEQSSSIVPRPAAARKKTTEGLRSVDHDDLLISYYGKWTGDEKFHRSNSPGAALDFTFKGSRIRWVGTKSSDHGVAEIYIDGELQQPIDTFSQNSNDDQVLFEKNGLNGNRYHTIRVLVSKERHPHSRGCYQDVAGFECEEPFNAAEQDAEAAFREVALIEARKQTYLPPRSWHKVLNVATSPRNNVTLHDGPLLTAFNRNIAYQINQWNLESTWTTWLPGANEGRRLAGAGNILRWTDNPILRHNLDELVASIANRQRSDGYALPYSDHDMSKQIYGANNERMPYDRRNFTLGLIAAGQVNETALRVARHFQDWVYASPYVNTMLDGSLGIMGDQPSVSLHHSPAGKDDDIVMREKYWRQDWWLEQLKDRQPAAISRFPLSRPHSYVLAPWIACCDAYRATGERKSIEAMLAAWQTYRDNFVHIGGSAAICESCDNAFPYKSYYLQKHTGENCGGAFWIDFNHRLLQLHPDREEFASQIEETLYNVTLANQDDAGNLRYHTNLVGTKDKAQAISTCCEVTNTNVLARLPEYLYSLADDGLYVNLYAPSTIAWEAEGTKITMEMSGQYFHGERVAMKLSMAKPRSFKIRLRIPNWTTPEVGVSVNREEIAKGRNGTYVTLDRRWIDGDQVTLHLPMSFRMTHYTGFDRNPDHERYALQYGPLLLSLIGGEHLEIAPERLLASLAPMSAGSLEFAIAGHRTCKYVPYWQIADETFTSYPTFA